MRSIRTLLVALVTALLIAAPAQAGKTKTYAPPGKAGASEYSEVVPTSGGNVQPPSYGHDNRTATQISALGHGKAGVHKLAALGKQGAQAAQFAQATAPTIVRSKHGLGGGPTGNEAPTIGHSKPLTALGSDSALSGIGHLISGSDGTGIGVFLPLLLAFGVGAAAAFALVRLRRGETDSPRA